MSNIFWKQLNFMRLGINYYLIYVLCQLIILEICESNHISYPNFNILYKHRSNILIIKDHFKSKV